MTIEANKKIVDYLDITLDLRIGVFKPFSKPNNVPLYVHRQSNHPPSILSNIPASINKRLSSISSYKESFDAAIPPYQEALRKFGYDYELNFNPDTPEAKRPRNTKIIWFNPPYSANVSTNIRHKFIQAINQSFPKTHVLHKIFNKNTLKLSYSCMPNLKSVIDMHNKFTLAKDQNKGSAPKSSNCNCRNKDDCPLEGKCLTESVIYQATVTRSDTTKQETYFGLTENQFKTRYRSHVSSFKNIKYRNSTELSKHIWTLKDANVQYSIKLESHQEM